MKRNRVADFDYDLPRELIAQEPLPERDRSRMLVLRRLSGGVTHTFFSSLPDYLAKGDLLVLNDTRVLPARLWGKKAGTGGKVEFLLLRQLEGNQWDVLCSPGRKARPGDTFHFAAGLLEGEILAATGEGTRTVLFKTDQDFFGILREIGETPLPPYIKKTQQDPRRYQTIFAQKAGSAAAPTAGLHFTPQTFQRLEDKGIELSFLTLHVGLGTFRPIKTEYVEEHEMHREYFELAPAAAAQINRAKARGSRVIAVGTTTCRVLESVSGENGLVAPRRGETGLFISPGYAFKLVDGLLTNFHLPRSTLLMMICAYAGKDQVFQAYREAIQKKYRFFSFGDCMLII